MSFRKVPITFRKLPVLSMTIPSATALTTLILLPVVTDSHQFAPSLVWHVVAIWVVVVGCLPRLPDFLRRLSRISVHGFSLELQATSDKLSSNSHYVYGELLANRKAWLQAAEQFLLMRKSHVPRVKFDGLLASSELIVRLSDAGRTLTSSATLPQLIEELRTAESFCCTALSYASSLPDHLRDGKKAGAYYHRAIVNARLVRHDPQNTSDGDVIEDLKNAVETDRDYLLQLSFDNELVNVLSRNSTKLTGELSCWNLASAQTKLTQEFLSKEN